MQQFNGHATGRDRPFHSCALMFGAAMIVGLAHVSDAAAQFPADTLTVAEAVSVVRDANPALAAARFRADAVSAQVPQAGALPDPMLSFALMNRPVWSFGTSEPMTMNQLQLTQTFPWPGKLGFGKERQRFMADAQQLEADEVEVALVARVQSVYFQIAYIDRALAIMEDTRHLLRDFLQVASAMYAVGTALQQDVLQAQVAIAAMTEDITVMQEERIAMAARLNALLGRDATVAVGALELPSPTSEPVPAVDSLIGTALAHRPALRAARARVDAATAGYGAARRELYPDFMISLGYGQRPQFDDMATLMVGISIPLFAGSRQLPMRREMLAMQAAEEAMEQDLYNETFARIAELRAEAERARRLIGLYATAVLPQAHASVESAMSAYRVGQVDYMTLVQSQMTVNRYAIEVVRLTADFHGAVAAIEALVGGRIGGLQ